MPSSSSIVQALMALLLCSLAVVVSAASSSDNQVVELTEYNFDKLVTNSDAPWIVAFVAPWCGHCQRLHPEYEKAAKSLGGVVNIGSINCDNEKGLAQRFGIRGFPTIKIFPAYKSSKQSPEDFQGARESSSIVNAALSLLNGVKDPVKNIDGDDLNSWILDEASPQNAKVVLFSSKTANPNLFKAIALEFTSRKVDFAFVGGDKLIEKFGIEKTPALLVFKSSSLEDYVKYDGQLKKSSMVQFVESNIAKGERGAPPPAPRKKKAASITLIEDKETLSKKCERMCVIGFVNSETESQLRQLAEKYPENTILQVNSGSDMDSELRGKFSIDSQEGWQIVVFRASKHKYALKQSITEINEASLLMDRVIGGDQAFHSLKDEL